MNPMNPRYHHRNIPQPQQPFYYNPYPANFSVPLAYNQAMSTHARYYNLGSEFIEFVDDVAILNSTPNTLIHYPWVMINQQNMHHSSSYDHLHNYDHYYYPTQDRNTSFDLSSDDYSGEFESFLEESLILLNLLADVSSQQQETATGGASGSGLREEKILEHLQVCRVKQEKKFGEESVDVCSICLDDYDVKKEKVAVLECGHRFHVECIKCWLMSKNVCPLCRSTALKV